MSERHILMLTKATVDRAIRGIVAAVNKGGWVLELRPANRTDEQNNALHSLITQIMRQRKHHNGVRYDKRKWKAAFMQALGEEIEFIPTLDGDAMFPLGLSTRELSKEKFSDLIELVLAWCAKEGIEVQHFDDGQGTGGANNPAREAA